jgi:hypothetical protein
MTLRFRERKKEEGFSSSASTGEKQPHDGRILEDKRDVLYSAVR